MEDLLLKLEGCFLSIHQKVENNIKNNNKVNRKIISNYTNQREYSEEFLNSLYANFNMKNENY